jgi:hypothetical protein
MREEIYISSNRRLCKKIEVLSNYESRIILLLVLTLIYKTVYKISTNDRYTALG